MLTGVAIQMSPKPDFDDTWAAPLALPHALAPYAASQPLFCTNEPCLKMFSSENATQESPCAECGHRLATRTLAEMRVLPDDTRMWKMKYTLHGKETYYASLVLSGVEKDSIHRPEICMVAQGYAITHERVTSFERPSGGEIQVKVLDLKKGDTVTRESTYAYWFFQAERHTPYHARRVIISTLDGTLKNTWTPWAYLAVHTATIQDRDMRDEQLMKFLQRLQVQISRDLKRAENQ